MPSCVCVPCLCLMLSFNRLKWLEWKFSKKAHNFARETFAQHKVIKCHGAASLSLFLRNTIIWNVNCVLGNRHYRVKRRINCDILSSNIVNWFGFRFMIWETGDGRRDNLISYYSFFCLSFDFSLTPLAHDVCPCVSTISSLFISSSSFQHSSLPRR